MDIKSSKLCLCRIGSDAAKDELEGQRSCRIGQSDARRAETRATRLMAGGGRQSLEVSLGVFSADGLSGIAWHWVSVAPVQMAPAGRAPE
jgi:hypothetical protein